MTQRILMTYTPRRGAVEEMLGTTGTVGQRWKRLGEHVAQLAKDRVNYYGRVDTGFMRNSIKSHLFQNGETVGVIIGSDAHYDIYQHEGTSRGISPAPFLTDAARQALGEGI